MQPRPETIRLDAREWPVRPLTLRQVQEIEPIIMSSAAEPKGNVAAALAIVANALGRDHADAAALLGDIEATAHARNRRRHGERYNLSLFRTMPGAVTGIFAQFSLPRLSRMVWQRLECAIIIAGLDGDITSTEQWGCCLGH
jgi:hypothetical protein